MLAKPTKCIVAEKYFIHIMLIFEKRNLNMLHYFLVYRDQGCSPPDPLHLVLLGPCTSPQPVWSGSRVPVLS